MPASLRELATEFGCELVGDPEVRVDRVATLATASPESVGFPASPVYRSELLTTTAVDRGAIDDTIIEDGVRLDNLIQVGHNARIGAHAAIAGMTAIAGSATVGKRCLIAGLSGVTGHVTVCEDVVITAQALITRDIREPGMYPATFGAEKDKDWKRMVVMFRRSEALQKRVAELEVKVNKNDG